MFYVQPVSFHISPRTWEIHFSKAPFLKLQTLMKYCAFFVHIWVHTVCQQELPVKHNIALGIKRDFTSIKRLPCGPAERKRIENIIKQQKIKKKKKKKKKNCKKKYATLFCHHYRVNTWVSQAIGPHREKNCLRGFRQSVFQTSPLSYWDSIEN